MISLVGRANRLNFNLRLHLWSLLDDDRDLGQEDRLQPGKRLPFHRTPNRGRQGESAPQCLETWLPRRGSRPADRGPRAVRSLSTGLARRLEALQPDPIPARRAARRRLLEALALRPSRDNPAPKPRPHGNQTAQRLDP